jgi:hypothetical protein
MNSIDVLDSWDIGMACIVFTLYIVGKVWMYYRIEDTTNTKKQKSKVIKRGNEWPE